MVIPSCFCGREIVFGGRQMSTSAPSHRRSKSRRVSTHIYTYKCGQVAVRLNVYPYLCYFSRVPSPFIGFGE